MAKYTIDASGLLCPMPVIRTQDMVDDLQTGDVLEIICTDPGALNDIPAWTRINGHKVLDTRQQDEQVIITIEVTH